MHHTLTDVEIWESALNGLFSRAHFEYYSWWFWGSFLVIQNSSTGFYSNRQHIYAKHLGSVNSALQSHCHNGALERTHIRYHEQPYWPRWQFKDLPTLTYMSHISILVALSVAMYCTKCTLSARLRVTEWWCRFYMWLHCHWYQSLRN